jgi:predicted ABC-type ATPase
MARKAQPPRLYVLAGVNGAGKSSIGGAMLRAAGADYYNADEVARELVRQGVAPPEANARAWRAGVELLERAIAKRLNFALETTLGGSTIPRLLKDAASSGSELFVWYVGLASADLHVARVASRVRRGGHDIPETLIRSRCERSLLNLVSLLPSITELRVYDNSVEGDPAAGLAPRPRLVLHVDRGKVIGPSDLERTPEWARPVVAAALRRAR